MTRRQHLEARLLLREIDAFLHRNSMTPTVFGLAAMNDGNFISRLRDGRTPTLPTLDRVRRFIKEHDVAQSPQ